MAIDLKDFVKAALADIVTAVKESQVELGGMACIAPTYPMGSIREDVKWCDNKYSKVSSIDFDVAVTTGVTENNNKCVSSGVSVLSVLSLGIGTKTGKTEEMLSQSISRIKFSIPVAFAMNAPNLNKFCEESR